MPFQVTYLDIFISQYIANAKDGIHGIDGILVGVDKHFNGQSQNEDNIKSDDQICNNYDNN